MPPTVKPCIKLRSRQCEHRCRHANGDDEDAARDAVRPAVKIGSPPRPHFQKSYWTLKRTKRAVRISVGMRHAAKLLFSVSTGLALSALKMSTLSIVRVPLNRMSLATRTSS